MSHDTGQNWSGLTRRYGWLALVLVLAACAIPMLIELDRRGPQHAMEGLALLTAQETWLRQHAGEERAWITPTRNGSVRVRKPPMFVWTCFAAWTGLDPDNATTELLIYRARLVGVGLTVVLLLCTYWIGCTIGDRLLGVLGAAVGGTLLLLQMQTRMASYDIHLAAWVALAVAASLQLIVRRTRAPTLGGQLGLWTIAVVALSCAIMTKGPVGLLAWAVPVVGAIVVTGRWKVGVIGSMSTVLGASALVLPWYLYLLATHESSLDTLLHEYGAELTNAHPWHYYPRVLLKLTFPWTLWLIGGLCLPFVLGSGQLRRERLIPWLWLVGYVLIFSINAGKSERYLAPLVPAIALVIAFAWYDHQRVAEQGEVDPRSRLVSAPHWVILTLASLGIAPFFVMQDDLAGSLISSPIAAAITWPIGITFSAAMLGVALVGWRWQRRWRPGRAALATFIWAVMLTTLGWYGRAFTSDPNALIAQSSRNIALFVGDAPLRYLDLVEFEADIPDYRFLLYLRRTVPVVTTRRLERLAKTSANPTYVISSTSRQHHDALRDHGFELLFEYDETPKRKRTLWTSRSAPPIGSS